MNVIIDFYKSLSPSIQSTIWITLILILLMVLFRIKIRNYTADKPAKGIVLFVESYIKLMNNFSKEMVGKRWRSLAPYFTTIATFIFVSNISGLFGFRPPTVSLSVTLTLALMSFFMIQFSGIRSTGIKEYLKGFASPAPMLPLNIISELVVPVSLSVRLFGNILSGSVLLSLIYGFFGWLALLVSPVLHAVFDIAFGLIQTLVFVMLTAVFIGNKLDDSEFEMEN